MNIQVYSAPPTVFDPDRVIRRRRLQFYRWNLSELFQCISAHLASSTSTTSYFIANCKPTTADIVRRWTVGICICGIRAAYYVHGLVWTVYLGLHKSGFLCGGGGHACVCVDIDQPNIDTKLEQTIMYVVNHSTYGLRTSVVITCPSMVY